MNSLVPPNTEILQRIYKHHSDEQFSLWKAGAISDLFVRHFSAALAMSSVLQVHARVMETITHPPDPSFPRPTQAFIDRFELVVLEALTNGCQHGQPGTTLNVSLICFIHAGERIVIVMVENRLNPNSNFRLPLVEELPIIDEHYLTARGRGWQMMLEADGLSMTQLVGYSLQVVLVLIDQT